MLQRSGVDHCAPYPTNTLSHTLRFMGSYKYGYKSPSLGYNL